MPGSQTDLRRTQDFIRAHMPAIAVPGMPEIRLHTAGPASGLWRLAGRKAARANGASQNDPASPYWAYLWAGGTALARHILDNPPVARRRRVLDLGSGSGIVAIAAAGVGAADVTAVDIDPDALAAQSLNAALNGVAFTTVCADLTGGPTPPVDLVAVGDLFYERDLAARVTAFLDRCLDDGIEVLVGDPWRTFLPRARLRLLGEYRVPDFGEPGAAKPAGVFAFMRGPVGPGAG